jgi:hypothetical protein
MGLDVAAFHSKTKTINAELEKMRAKPASIGEKTTKSKIEQMTVWPSEH